MRLYLGVKNILKEKNQRRLLKKTHRESLTAREEGNREVTSAAWLPLCLTEFEDFLLPFFPRSLLFQFRNLAALPHSPTTSERWKRRGGGRIICASCLHHTNYLFDISFFILEYQWTHSISSFP